MTGRGMLPVTTLNDATGGGTPSLMMTRTGAFRPDAGGLLRTESGLVLMGWPTAADGSMPLVARDTSAALQPIRIESNRPVGDPTTQVSLGANLPATETLPTGSGDPLPLRVEYFGNLGTSESLDITFTPDTSDPTGMSNTWTVSISDSASDPATNPISTFQVTFDDSQGAGGALLNVVGGGYDPATGAIPLTVGGGNIELSIGVPGGASGLKQLAASFSPSNVVKNGSPVGQLVAVEVDPQGYVKATYDTGFVKALYKIPVIDVPNPNGLVAVEGQAFKTSPDSGGFFLWDAGDGPTGSVQGYALEESTTDVAEELTHLIQTQRAYSSNAKIIQTVDEMLQETTNIKR